MVSPQESLKEKMLLDSFSETVTYIPEKYSETEIDTTMSNGFRVFIKTFTDMDSSVLNEVKQDTIIHKTYFRNSIINIEVAKNGKELFNENFEKDFFIEKYPEYNGNLENSVLQLVWLDDNRFNENKVFIKIAFCIPDSEICFDYDLTVHGDGSYSIKETDKEKTI